MATDSVPDDNAIYVQVTKGVNTLKVRIDELVEKNASLESEWRLKCQQLSVEKEHGEKLHTDELKRLQGENNCLMTRLNDTQEELTTQRKEKEAQEKKCQHLTRDLKKSEQNIKQAFEGNTKLQSMNARLENDLRALKITYEKLQIDKKDLELVHLEKVKQSSATNKLAIERLARIQQLEQQLINQHHKNEVAIKQKAAFTNTVISDFKKKEEEIRKLNLNIQEKDNTFQQMSNYFQSEASKQSKAHERAIEKERNRHFSLSEQYRLLDDERSTLVLRLSKIAGPKLTAGNANIADLSDDNRPTKLAEKFSELYDNEWTDAFENVCEEMKENEGIQYMLGVLQTAFNLCNEITTGHFESMKKSATTVEFTMKKQKTGAQNDETQKVELAKDDTQNQNMSTANVDRAPEEEVIKRDAVQPKSPVVNTSLQTPDDLNNTGNVSKPGVGEICPEKTPDNITEKEHMETDENEGFCVVKPLSTGQTPPDQTPDHTFAGPTKDQPYFEVGSQQKQREVQTDVDTGVVEPIEHVKVKTETVSITLSDSLTAELYKQLLDLKKLIAIQMQGNVLQEITKAVAIQFNVTEEKTSHMYKYLAKCVELCWYMGLQEPPLQVVFEIPNGKTKFDANMYKPWTSTGKHLAYIVWPPLFLKEGGPMLMKGVAQGTK